MSIWKIGAQQQQRWQVMMMMLLLLMKIVMMARHDEKLKKEVLCAKQGLPLLLLCQTAANRPLNSPPMTKVDHKQKIRRKIQNLTQTKDEHATHAST